MKTKNKFLLMFVIFCLFCALYLLASNYIIVRNEADSIVSPDELTGDFDCVIVLGAGVRDDGSPSAMLADRMLVGIELYQRGASDVLLLSGDHGREDYDEVNCMKRLAEEAGVPTDRIFLDHAGFCTYDSIYRLRNIFGGMRVVIVSQDYHLPRALWIAERLGMEAYGVAANPREYYGQIKRDIRECIARSHDFLRCIFLPESQYLGEPISLEGSGTVTHDK